MPKLLPLLYFTSKLLHLACVPPIIHTRNTLLCLQKAVEAFQGKIFVNFSVLLIVVANVCWLLFFVFLVWGLLVSLWKIYCSFLELEVILSKHLVMTQAAYQIHITCDSLSWGWPVPGKLDFVYFQTVPYIYMGPGCDDTSARWKCSLCSCPSSKGLMIPPLVMWHRKHLRPILFTLTCALKRLSANTPTPPPPPNEDGVN